MGTLIVKPDSKEKSDAIKAFMKGLKDFVRRNKVSL